MAVVIDIPTRPHATVIDNLDRKIRDLDADAARSFEPNIIRVPDDIRKGHDEAYVPRMLFIGPYHKKDSPMQETKLMYLKDLLERDPQKNNVSCYVDKIFNVLEEAKKQYSDRVGVDQIKDDDFVEMLVVDGCFIIEFLLKRAGTKDEQPNFDKLRTSPTLRRDLLLLENQIPFIVLQTILQNSNYASTNIQGNNITLIDLALHYVSKGEIHKNKLIQRFQRYRKESEIYHLLHLSYLCHMYDLTPPVQPKCENFTTPLRFIRKCASLVVIYLIYCIIYVLTLLFFWRKPNWSLSNKETTDKPRMIPSASELHEAGVTFMKKKDKKPNSGCLDVSFDREGFFHIPFLSIQESTDSVFRNILAFEQTCRPNVGNNFTSYVVLMDNLINTSTDVAILKQNGVLQSKLGCDDDVAKLFNEMRSGLCFDFNNHYLSNTFKDVNHYWNKDHNRWRAKLMHDYFGTPWTFISLVAATVLLGLTAAQTVYSVLSFYN